MRTLSEIRSHLASVTGETQINDLIGEFINLTLLEINDPAWATKGYRHLWTFNRRKHSFATVASTEFYQLPRDVDIVTIVRQTSSPFKLSQVPDELFYDYIPNPTETGNPLFYRFWEQEGLEVRLSTDDTLKVSSSSASDSSAIKVILSGYDTSGIKRSEELSLNGTTAVDGTITWDAGRSMRISKSDDTAGLITVAEKTSSTTLLVMGEHERSPRFKVIGLYPIPSSAITIYLEYYTSIRRLEHDSQVPDINDKWLWVVKLGALTKIYQHQEPDSQRVITTQELYRRGVESMVKSDLLQPDYIPHLRTHRRRHTGVFEIGDNNWSLGF
ncbi:hypothetical protein KKF61_07990 [Patescibacteria group bacterium]|nr:hypothetical protein [Patescibacteria group bacterium]